MKTRFFVLLLSFVCAYSAVHGQADYFDAFEVQMGWQRSGFIDLGWNARWDMTPSPSGGFIKMRIPGNQHSFNVNLGASHGFRLNETALQLRTGYDFYWSFAKDRGGARFFLAGLQTQVISDFNQVDLRIMPETGLHLWGLIYVKYGYAIPLLEHRFEHLSPHRLAVGLSIPLI